jgi:hypothetical protein
VAVVEQEHLVVQQVLLADGLAVGQRVAEGDRQDEGVAVERQDLQVLELGLERQQQEVQLALLGPRHEARRLVLGQQHPQLGVGRVHRAHRVRQGVGRHRRDHAEPQGAGQGLAERPRRLGQGVDVRQDGARALGQLGSRRGRQDAAPVALEEPDAEQRLDLLDLRAERRLRHVAGLGGLAEAQVVRHRDDRLQVAHGGPFHRRSLSR